jgi:hypothetical protein
MGWFAPVWGRFLVGVAVGVLGTLAGLLAMVVGLRSLAISDGCATLPREELTVDEMVALRLRIDAYTADPSEPLAFSARETSFVVREVLGVPAWVDAQGGDVTAEFRVPSGSRCYDVSFTGTFEVKDGVAHLVPSELVVGRLNLSALAAGRRVALEPSHVESVRARDLLGHVVALWVADGRVNLRVDDPEALASRGRPTSEVP